MTVWTQLKEMFGQKRIETVNQLGVFLESRAAYLVQKSITEYAQARANLMFSTLLSEKSFSEAYDRSRWLAYPAGLSMVSEVSAGELRTRFSLDGATAAQIVGALGEKIVADMRGHGPLSEDDWSTACASLHADLARAALGPPHPAHAIVQQRAREVFDALPFHAAFRKHDFGMFRNTLAFHLAEIATELEQSALGHGVKEHARVSPA
jgi:hypothetical protein